MDEVKIRVTADNDANKTWSDIRGEASKLGDDLGKIGDKAGEQLTRGIDGRLRDSKGRFAKVGAEVGAEVGKVVGTSLGDSFKLAGKAMPQILGTAAALASPLIGATISAAVIGGVSIGAAGLGVALAAKNPQVQAAGKGLGKSLMSGLLQDSSGFIQPVLKQIDKIGVAFEAQRPRIRNIFNDSAGFLDPLVDGALKGIDGIMSGVEDLVHNGGPVVDSFGRLFANLGDAVGDAFSMISGGSKDAAGAVDDLSVILGGTVRVVGLVIRGLTEAYGVLKAPLDPVFRLAKAMGLLGDEQTKAAETAPPVADGLGKIGASADQAVTPLMTMAEKMNLVSDASGNLYDSSINVEEALDNVTAAVKENGKSFDISTPKGRDNAKAFSSLAKSLISNYEAYVKVNGEGPKADGVMARNRQSFINAATAAGKSKGAAEAFATSLGLLPAQKSVKIDAKTAAAMENTREIKRAIGSVRGANPAIDLRIASALEDAREIRRAIGSIKGKTVTVTVRRVNAGGATPRFEAHGGVVGAAENGATSNGMTWVGEAGPELLDLPPGTQVHTAGDSQRLAAQANGMSNSGPIIINFVVDGKVLQQATVEPNRKFVRDNFGGSVQAAYGS